MSLNGIFVVFVHTDSSWSRQETQLRNYHSASTILNSGKQSWGVREQNEDSVVMVMGDISVWLSVLLNSCPDVNQASHRCDAVQPKRHFPSLWQCHICPYPSYQCLSPASTAGPRLCLNPCSLRCSWFLTESGSDQTLLQWGSQTPEKGIPSDDPTLVSPAVHPTTSWVHSFHLPTQDLHLVLI